MSANNHVIPVNIPDPEAKREIKSMDGITYALEAKIFNKFHEDFLNHGIINMHAIKPDLFSDMQFDTIVDKAKIKIKKLTAAELENYRHWIESIIKKLGDLIDAKRKSIQKNQTEMKRAELNHAIQKLEEMQTYQNQLLMLIDTINLHENQITKTNDQPIGIERISTRKKVSGQLPLFTEE